MTSLSARTQTILGWSTVIATLVSPFGTNFYDALVTDDVHFVYSFEYEKNPVLEWNRQISIALSRLHESIKDEGDLPKSLLRGVTKELINNAPALAAYADLRPFDKMTVRIVNVSHSDIKDIKVIFHDCSGYDSHTTYPDTTASPESSEALRKVPDPKAITYRKLNRQDPELYYHGYITFYGADASKCRPEIIADTDSGKSAKGRKENIDDYIAKRNSTRQRWSEYFDTIFKLGMVAAAGFLFFQVRTLRKALKSAA